MSATMSLSGWTQRLGQSQVLRSRLVVVTLTVILGFLCAYPLAMLFFGSFYSTQPGLPGELNLDGYRQVLSAENVSVLWNTIIISLIKTIISISLAILLAWIIARTDTPGRMHLEVLITLPFFIPGLLTATSWGMLANPQVGVINTIWKAMTGSTDPLVNIYSYGGVIWHMSQASTTFLFLFLVEAFRAMDPSLEEASRISGASRWTTTRRVTLVLMAPMITSCFLLSFIKGLEAFDSALIFGYPAGIKVVTTQIFYSLNQSIEPNYQAATALSFVTLLFMIALILIQQWMLRGRSFQTVTGKGFSPKLIKLGPWRWVTFGVCILFFLITVALPVGQLLVGSVFKYFGFYRWELLTLDHYKAVFSNRQIWQSAQNTFFLALTGASATMVLGSLIAYVSTRTKWGGRRIIETLAWLPWLMPGMVLGVGFLWAFALLPHWVPIYGTIWALFLAYVALGTPVAVRVMSASFSQLANDLEECSRTSGANWLQTLRRIVIALVMPSFFVGWMMTFFSIMRELSVSILLYSAGNEVLSVTLMRLWTDGRVEQVSVIGLMMMLLVIVMRLAQHMFMRRTFAAIA